MFANLLIQLFTWILATIISRHLLLTLFHFTHLSLAEWVKENTRRFCLRHLTMRSSDAFLLALALYSFAHLQTSRVTCWNPSCLGERERKHLSMGDKIHRPHRAHHSTNWWCYCCCCFSPWWWCASWTLHWISLSLSLFLSIKGYLPL